MVDVTAPVLHVEVPQVRTRAREEFDAAIREALRALRRRGDELVNERRLGAVVVDLVLNRPQPRALGSRDARGARQLDRRCYELGLERRQAGRCGSQPELCL